MPQPEKGRGITHAVTSNRDGSNRGGCSTLASQSLRTDGWIDQLDLECRSGDRRGLVAPEHFRTFSFLLPDSRWVETTRNEPRRQVLRPSGGNVGNEAAPHKNLKEYEGSREVSVGIRLVEC